MKEGEERHASFCAERVSEEPPPTVPVDFVAELAQLRSLVAELQREREELRSELGQRGVATPPEEGRPRKSIQSLSTPAVDLMVPHNQLAISGGSSRNLSVLMETLIDGGSAAASHRLHPMQQWRTAHVCVFGESQDTGCEACEWANRLTQGRCVQGGGISIRLKWTVILTTTRGCCPPTIRRSWGGRMWCARRLQMFQCESSTLGWMILLRTQNLLPLCLSRLRVCWVHWSKICTRFPRGVWGRWLLLHWRAPQVWHREARGAEQLVRDLASRIGPVPIGAEVPRAVPQQ